MPVLKPEAHGIFSSLVKATIRYEVSKLHALQRAILQLVLIETRLEHRAFVSEKESPCRLQFTKDRFNYVYSELNR